MPNDGISYAPPTIIERSSNEDVAIHPVLLPVGTIIRREWRGEWYEVTIAEPMYPKLYGARAAQRYAYHQRHGHWRYIYEGKRYRSLAAIAKIITGHKCSGNQFFGLMPRCRGDRCRKSPIKIL